MNERICKYFDMIYKQPILDIGRASNMLWIAIGDLFVAANMAGEVKKSTYALHVQSAWRMLDETNNKIIFASSDMYEPNSTMTWSEEFDWEVQGSNLFDEKAKKWLQESGKIVVEEYEISAMGDLKVFFSNKSYLQIIVDFSNDAEAWRLFKCNSNEEHLVGRGEKIIFE